APIYRPLFAWWSPSTLSQALHREPVLESCSVLSFRKSNQFSADRKARIRSLRPGVAAESTKAAMSQARMSADDLRPGAGLGEALNKTEALGLGRLEAARRHEDFLRRIRPHQRGKATGAEHDAEAQARHSEPGRGSGDPPIAGGHQVGASSQRAAVAQRER